MSFGKLLRIAALLIVAYAVVHATQTFSVTPSAGSQFFALRAESEFLQHQSSGTVHAVGLAAPASHCGAAVVDAWHAKSARGGWFGYAPLTTDATLIPALPASCRSASRHRLRVSLVLMLVALTLVVVARWVDRGHRPGLDPAAT